MTTPRHVPRRIRRNTKPLEALKAASIIIGLLMVCILILWVATQLFRPKEPEPEPDLAPRPGNSLWEKPVPLR